MSSISIRIWLQCNKNNDASHHYQFHDVQVCGYHISFPHYAYAYYTLAFLTLSQPYLAAELLLQCSTAVEAELEYAPEKR
jgi:hypothetical protein